MVRSIVMDTSCAGTTRKNAVELSAYHTNDRQDEVPDWALKTLRFQRLALDAKIRLERQPFPASCSCRGCNKGCVAPRLHDSHLREYEGNRGHPKHAGAGGCLHPSERTCQIKEAATTEALLWTHRADENHVNNIHLSACWSSVG